MLIRTLLRSSSPFLHRGVFVKARATAGSSFIPTHPPPHRKITTTTTNQILTSNPRSPNDTPTSMKALVTRFYNDIWNVFDTRPINDILAPEVLFRGTLETQTTDREGFRAYVREIGGAFPDFYQRIDGLYVDGDTCVARMHWSGTHTRSFRGVEPTGKSFEYEGVGIFRVRDGRIVDCWVVGDVWGMWKTILGVEEPQKRA